MDIVNAIAKARFASARPQRVQLHKGGRCPIDLLCLEPGQRFSGGPKRCAYYVLAGSAKMEAGGKAQALAPGYFAVSAEDEPHILFAEGQQRLLCLAIGVA